MLRREVLSRRAALPAADRHRLETDITARLLDLPEVSRASFVLAYLSFGTEYSTEALVSALLARGCVLALPRVDRENRRLVVYRVRDPRSDTTSGVWGIREPNPACCEPANLHDIDAVLIPGVAFTRTCDRLGYGGGYYDRLLAQWSQQPPLVAAAFVLQLEDELPVGPSDHPVDTVVTEDEVIRRNRN